MGLMTTLTREYKYISALLRMLRSVKTVDPDSNNLVCDDLEKLVDKHGKNTAFIEDDNVMTYDDFETYANRVAHWALSEGCAVGDTVAVFEATHGTAPKYAGQDKVNPGSLILSAELMLTHLGWKEAAQLVIKGMAGAIKNETVTYDFARLMDGAKQVSCSQFGDEIIKHM